MGINYLWDSNIVIYYLQQQFPATGEIFIDNMLKQHPPAISVITEIELLCWKSPAENDLTVLHNFISECTVFELETQVKLKTVEIRKAVNIKLPDAIIAATSLTFDLTLLTRNTGDFEKIHGLKIINPWTA
jgi:predicted nucleic acid-binding protein